MDSFKKLRKPKFRSNSKEFENKQWRLYSWRLLRHTIAGI